MAEHIAPDTEMLVAKSAGKRLLKGVGSDVVNYVTHFGGLEWAKLAINCFVVSAGYRVDESFHAVHFFS